MAVYLAVDDKLGKKSKNGIKKTHYYCVHELYT